MFPPCCLTWVQIMVEVDEDNGDLLQKVPCTHCYTQCPQPWSRPPPAHASAGDSWTLTGNLCQSLLGSLLLSPGSWCTQGFVCAFQESVSQSWVSSGGSMVGLMATSSKRAYALYSLYHNHVSMLHYSQTETSLLKLILLFLSMYIMHIKNLQWRNEVGK